MICQIRTDGETQQRVTCDSFTVEQYAELMQRGVVFPPVLVWNDGECYWLVDGFHRLAAARRLSRTTITAEICFGSLSDAQWQSYGANSTHGLRRNRDDIQLVISRALQHPKAATISNVELAHHLGIPETTLRRWRSRLSSPSGEDGVRVVNRGDSTYVIRTAKIGKVAHAPAHKKHRQLGAELTQMRTAASNNARRLLNVVANWALGSAGPVESLRAIEAIVRDCYAASEDSQPAGERRARTQMNPSPAIGKGRMAAGG